MTALLDAPTWQDVVLRKVYPADRSEAWRRASRLWRFTAQVSPAGRIPDHGELDDRYAITRDDFAAAWAVVEATGALPPVRWHHGTLRQQVVDYGLVLDSFPRPDGWLVMEGFACFEPAPSQPVSVAFSRTKQPFPAIGGRHLFYWLELSILGAGVRPAMRGARVLDVEEMTAAEVAAVKANRG